MDSNTNFKDIKELEKLASDILDLKEQLKLRRPILIEFCGSPKAGKTTTITSLNIFLKRNGFRTKILTERAGICPVTKKTHPLFNIWTLCSAISEIIKYLLGDVKELDIIIADRGIFDALCWFEWLNKNDSKDNPYLDTENFKILESFATMDIWRNKLDIVYIFKVPPTTSIKREYANLLTRKKGSIMNEKVLETYNIAMNGAIKKHKNKFRRIEQIDTSEMNPSKVGFTVTSTILQTLRDLLEENIGYISDDSIKSQLSDGVSDPQIIESSILNFGGREEIEKSDHIQPIPIAIITNSDRTKVLVVKKHMDSVSKSSPEKDKLLLYLGGHIRKEDQIKINPFDTFKRCLYREIEEEIGESFSLKVNRPSFLIYDSTNAKSKKHLAVCFIITLDLENKSFNPTSEEFVLKKGTSKSGRILSINEIAGLGVKFESWSQNILKEVFNTQIKEELNLFNYKDSKKD